MVRLLNNMRDITANKKLTSNERLNSTSVLQIQFDKLTKESGLLTGAIPPQVALETAPAARPVQPKVLAVKGIEPEIEPEKEEDEEQYDDVLDEKDRSDQANALSPQMARVIRWNVPSLYKQKAQRLFKKITEQPDIFTRNDNRKLSLRGCDSCL